MKMIKIYFFLFLFLHSVVKPMAGIVAKDLSLSRVE